MDEGAGAPYTRQPISWERTGDGEFPYRAHAGAAELLIRVNDFPAEPLYTLLVDGRPDLDLDDWPASWVRSRPPAGVLRTAAAAQFARGRFDAIVTAGWASTLCGLPPGSGATAVAALGLDGTLVKSASLWRLEPPPAGIERLVLGEDQGDVSSVEAYVAAGPSQADLDALLGPGRDVPRVHYDSPYPRWYDVRVAGAPRLCDLFAYFSAPPADGGGATSVLFRLAAADRWA